MRMRQRPSMQVRRAYAVLSVGEMEVLLEPGDPGIANVGTV